DPALDVAVREDLAFVANGDSGLRIVNVSNPDRPNEVGFFLRAGYTRAVSVQENYAYVADEDSGLRVIDVSDPANPQQVGRVVMPDVPVFAFVPEQPVSDTLNLVYLAVSSRGMRMVNATNPRRPQPFGHYNTPGSASGLCLSGSTVFVADGEAGLQIYYHRPVGAILERPAFGKAFDRRRSPTLARGVLRLPGKRPALLVDVSGRTVAGLSPGLNDLRQVVPGVYFVCRQQEGERSAVFKIVVQR
ncbi:MAG: hypothetical protein JSU73_00790, partial [candidate division WOR-3 bacterium]